jgi:hypothetical protein
MAAGEVSERSTGATVTAASFGQPTRAIRDTSGKAAKRFKGPPRAAA